MHLCLHTTHQKACLVSITRWLCMVVVKSTKSFTYYTTSKWHPRIVESFSLCFIAKLNCYVLTRVFITYHRECYSLCCILRIKGDVDLQYGRHSGEGDAEQGPVRDGPSSPPPAGCCHLWPGLLCLSAPGQQPGQHWMEPALCGSLTSCLRCASQAWQAS